MKKFYSLVLAFAICLGLTACGKEGGTLEVIVLGFSRNVQILFDDVEVFNGVLEDNQSVKKSKDKDFSYKIVHKRVSGGDSGMGPATQRGTVAGGDIVTVRLDSLW
jgi:hypothetical protein